MTFDPNSILTQGEIEDGFTYSNSHRDWSGQPDWMEDVAKRGHLSPKEIVAYAPRVLNSAKYKDDPLSLKPIEEKVNFPSAPGDEQEWLKRITHER